MQQTRKPKCPNCGRNNTRSLHGGCAHCRDSNPHPDNYYCDNCRQVFFWKAYVENKVVDKSGTENK